jgi:hypothetical protein
MHYGQMTTSSPKQRSLGGTLVLVWVAAVLCVLAVDYVAGHPYHLVEAVGLAVGIGIAGTVALLVQQTGK